MSQNLFDTLTQLQADYTILSQKLLHYHWNVRGPQFFRLHEEFEELYTESSERVDQIAERLVMLGGQPLVSLSQCLKAASLPEDESTPAAGQMLTTLHADYCSLETDLRSGVQLAEKGKDPTTANMLEEFANSQQKTIWMLQAAS